MFDKFSIALKSIKKNKNRNFLTMLGIIIGISSVICILAIGDGFTHKINSENGSHNDKNRFSLDYTPKAADENSNNGFTNNDAYILENIPGVDHVKLDSSYGDSDGSVSYNGKKTSMSLNKAPKKVKLSKGKVNSLDPDDPSGVFISSPLANRLFKGVSPLNKALIVNDNTFIVKGVYHVGDMEYKPDMYVSKSVFKELFADQIIQDEAKIYVTDSANKKKIGKIAVEKMKKFGENKQTGKYKVLKPDAMTKSFTKILNYVTYFVAFVAGISLLIAGIGVMNVMYITVSERRKEIGIRRAFGATSSDIRNQFLIESVVLCMMGGIVGIIMGYLFVELINVFLPFKAIITVYAVVISLSVSTAVGLIFGYIPSNKAAKSPLVGLLKEE